MLWIKAFHIVAVIAWMAALLYLPRLLVYHAGAARGSDLSETFKVMERRLLRAIATPAMLASWGLGVWLATLTGAWQDGWLWAKFVCVLALSAYHGLMAGWVRAFALDRNERQGRFFRLVNEIPALIMVAIVILVVVKPF